MQQLPERLEVLESIISRSEEERVRVYDDLDACYQMCYKIHCASCKIGGPQEYPNDCRHCQQPLRKRELGEAPHEYRGPLRFFLNDALRILSGSSR